jgi:hypothetical protein
MKGENVSKYVDKRTKQLDNLKKMVDNTSGEVKEMWINKWYQLIRKIAVEIRQEKGNSHN